MPTHLSGDELEADLSLSRDPDYLSLCEAFEKSKTAPGSDSESLLQETVASCLLRGNVFWDRCMEKPLKDMHIDAWRTILLKQEKKMDDNLSVQKQTHLPGLIAYIKKPESDREKNAYNAIRNSYAKIAESKPALFRLALDRLQQLILKHSADDPSLRSMLLTQVTKIHHARDAKEKDAPVVILPISDEQKPPSSAAPGG